MDAKELTVELIAHNTVSYNSNIEVMKYLRKQMLEIDCHVEWIEYVDPNGVQKVNLIGKKGGNHDPGDRGSRCSDILTRCPQSVGNRMRSRLGSREPRCMDAEVAT